MRDFNTVKSDLIRHLRLSCQKTDVMLLPARTDTAWYHDYCKKGRVHFIRGRLRFNGAKSNAPFPSIIVVFGEGEA